MSDIITIFVKQYTGKTITINMQKNSLIYDVYLELYDKIENKEILFLDYFTSISLLFRGINLNIQQTLKSYNISNNNTINEILKGWTIGGSFNFKTLSATDELTNKKINIPYILNPGCCHLFDKNNISNLIKLDLKICPICITQIKLYHIDILKDFEPDDNEDLKNIVLIYSQS